MVGGKPFLFPGQGADTLQGREGENLENHCKELSSPLEISYAVRGRITEKAPGGTHKH